MKDIYNIVLNSQIKAINEIKAGMTVAEADALSRDYIESHGISGRHSVTLLDMELD